MASGRHEARVQQGAAAAQALGFTGTPTFQFVHQASGKTSTLAGAQPANVFSGWIDALLAGKEPPEAKQTAKPELPPWAKPESLAPDPKRPGFTVDGDPYKGNPGAKLVVVEFADFECPSCRRHALETQPALDTAVRRRRRGHVGRQALPPRDASSRPRRGRRGGVRRRPGEVLGDAPCAVRTRGAVVARQRPGHGSGAACRRLKLDGHRL